MTLTRNITAIVIKLTRLARVLCRGGEFGDWLEFHEQLAGLFELSPKAMRVVVTATSKSLGDMHDDEALAWLVNELEIESCLRTLDDPVTQRPQSCLLFALPVVVPAGEVLSQYVEDDESFELMHDVLAEARVLSESARFRLLPRLFSHRELDALGYRELHLLSGSLAEQMMAGRTELELPPGVVPAGPPQRDRSEVSPYVELYYVVGCATIAEPELDDIFPSLATELPDEGRAEADDEDDESSALKHGPSEEMPAPFELEGGSPGEMDDGSAWERAFLMAFDQTFHVLQGADAVLPPDGIHEDRRRGLAIAREVGLLRSLDCVPDVSRARARVSALHEPDEGPSYLLVSWVDIDTGETYDEVRWTLFPQESASGAITDLMSALEDTDIDPEDEALAARGELSAFLLH